MSYYCWKCRKNTESKTPKVVKAKNGRVMLLLKCAVCKQYVFGLSSAIICLYPFSNQKTFFTSTNLIFNIITYTHPFCTLK